MQRLFIPLCLIIPYLGQAQLLGKSEIGKFIEKTIEDYAPELLTDIGGLKDVSLDKFKMKKKSIVAKGRLNVVKTPESVKDPFRFKAKLRVKDGFGLKHLKVHPPGKSFLGIRFYKKVFPR
jgi:hypothetical protein